MASKPSGIRKAITATVGPAAIVLASGRLPSAGNTPQAAPAAATPSAPVNGTPPYRPTRLYHYTNEAGYNGINNSQTIKASTIEGLRNTHYGKGVYFSPFGPGDLGVIGAHEFCTRLFSKCDAYAIDRIGYFFEVSVDVSLSAEPAWDSEYHIELDDIWLVLGEEDLDVSGRILSHGRTDLGPLLRGMTPKDTAVALKQENDRRKLDGRLLAWSNAQINAREPARKKRDIVFIGGRDVKRPEDWDEDFLGSIGS